MVIFISAACFRGLRPRCDAEAERGCIRFPPTSEIDVYIHRSLPDIYNPLESIANAPVNSQRRVGKQNTAQPEWDRV